MAKQTAIEWLAGAGVDCAELNRRLAVLSDSHADKIIKLKDGSESRVTGEAVPDAVLTNVIRQFVDGKQITEALIQEVAEEFRAAQASRSPLKLAAV